MHKKNVLIIGSGGREHAIAWKIAQSPLLHRLYIAPGNGGTGFTGTNIPISDCDFEAIKRVVLENDIDIVVVGPENPLVQGIADFFESDNLLQDVLVVGPSKLGARLEGSKDFAKQFMKRHQIPTAAYETFDKSTINKAIDFLGRLSAPYVLKADGLAAGEGVIICNSLDEAVVELKSMLFESKFGEASSKVVIEEFLNGIELSAFVITDGISYKVLPEAKDYKRVGVGNTGPNTGGMGAVSPVPFAGSDFMRKVEERIIKPTVNGLLAENIPYKGFIFFGLMNVNGDPYVIEYNVRLGDPETEVIMPRIKSDFLKILIDLGENRLQDSVLELHNDTAVAVMMVSGGYPGTYQKGMVINGLDNSDLSVVFHAGTEYLDDSQTYITAGGRVLAVSATGDNMSIAREKVYKGIGQLSFTNHFFRTDIGNDLML